MAEKSPEEVEFDKAKKYGGDTRSWMRIYLKRLKEAAKDGNLKECRLLINELRKQKGKLDGVYARMKRAVVAFERSLGAGVAPAQALAVTFPPDLTAMTMGSQEELDKVRFTRAVDASGQRWIVRKGADAGNDHLVSETVADGIYASFGIGAPASRMYGDDKLTQEVEGRSLYEYLSDSSVSDADKERARDQFIEGLDVDCMLSNWSCVGGFDKKAKFAVIKDGRIYRTMSSGAMSFKVSTGKKASDMWNDGLKDFFKLWTFDNQKMVLGGRVPSVLAMMRKTLKRDWQGAMAKMTATDSMVVRGRLANIAKVVAYGDKIEADPDVDTSDVSVVNELLENFVESGYKEPPKRMKPKGAGVLVTLKEQLKRFTDAGREIPKTLKNLGVKQDRWYATHNYIRDKAKEQKVVDVMGQVMEKCELGMRADGPVIDMIVKSWFKNLHETGTGNGSTNKAYRRRWSESAFGTEPGTPAKEMEKYGFAFNDKDRQFRRGNATNYGNWIFTFSRKKLEDKGVAVTFTIGDSLGSETAPSLITDPGMSSFEYAGDAQNATGFLGSEQTIEEMNSHIRREYIELQYHGEFGVECCDELLGRKSDLDEIGSESLDEMDRMGVKIRLWNGSAFEDLDVDEELKRRGYTRKK